VKSRRLRIGIIGAGGISGIHCEGWKKLKDCELVAVTDINLKAARARAAEFSIPAVERTGRALLARKDIDTVDIVTPNRFHKVYTVAALRAGKHVLCEKPLALTVAEVDTMIAAAAKARRKLMCAQHMRFQDDAVALKGYLHRHPLGEVYYARAWCNRRRLLPTTAGFIFRKNAGGGACIDVGVHLLDLAMHLMDNFRPASVCGVSVCKLARRKETWSEWNWGLFDKKRLDVEDFAAGLVRFADGAVLSLECSWMLNQKSRAEQRIDLFGTRAGAKWPECEYYDHTDNGFADTVIDVRKSGAEPHCRAIRAFAEAVMGGRPVPVLPEQSRAVISVLAALYRSQKLHREVKV